MALKSIVDLVEAKIKQADPITAGIMTSPVYRRYDKNLSDWLWVVDIDLNVGKSNPNAGGDQQIIGAAIDDISREVYSAEIGTHVTLEKRQEDNRYVVTGLSKYKANQISVRVIQIAPCGTFISGIGDPVLTANQYRVLTYTELGDDTLHGFFYGDLPYGTSAKFDINDVLIKLNTGN